MANYLLLFSGGSMPISDLERQAHSKEWDAWFKRLGKAVVDGGHSINAQSRAVTGDMNVIPVTGGPTPSGYAIIQARNMDEAVELARSCPVIKHGAEVMVYETFDSQL